MKKTILSIVMAAISFAVVAQENMMSKRGTSILPEVGDYAISFDASPFLRYAGSMFSQNGNPSPTADYTYNNPFTIVGLYVNAPNSAYRGKVRLGFGSDKQDEEVLILGNNPNNLTTTNTVKAKGTNITIGAGLQKSRGKHRLHGVYGADAYIQFGSGLDTTFTYGQGLLDTLPPQFANPRVTKVNSGSQFGFGVRGFIGVEYFFAPKISINAQYGWGLAIMSTGTGKVTEEYVDNSTGTPVRKTRDSETGKSSSFGADVDNNGGSIAITFYF